MEVFVDKKRFWAIIEKSSKGGSSSREEQAAELRRQLESLSPQEVVGFQTCFYECIAELYRWDLWGAAYVINGGCSDDGFEYFRDWLISKGQKVYEEALRDPETLASVIVDAEEECQFEEFGYIATQVWEQKTGRDLSEFPFPDLERPDSPAGKEWSEDGDDLMIRFPKLWKRF
jgi:hypothetical protein